MPIHVQWENEEKTIACWIFEGRWTWEEYRAMLEQTKALLATVNHTVDIFADMTASFGLPSNSFSNFRQIDLNTPPNRGKVIVIGPGVFAQTMIETFNRLFRSKASSLLIARTCDEAYALVSREPSY